MARSNYEKHLTGFIIHSFAVAHAAAAATLSQTLLGDEAVLTALTVSMITCVSAVNGRKIGVGQALSYMGVLAGTYLGTRGAVFLVKWIPGIGNAANAMTTFAVTEFLGWMTYVLVKEEKDPTTLTDAEKKDIKSKAKKLQTEEKESSKRSYDQMSLEDKKKVDIIMKQLRNKDLSEETIYYLTKELEDISKKYATDHNQP